MIFKNKGATYTANATTNELVQSYLTSQNDEEQRIAYNALKTFVKHKLRQQHKVSPIRILNILIDERGIITVKTHPKRD